MRTILDGLRGVVHPNILVRTEQISRMLTTLGVPHALIGGLAVGVHGHPRATKDVDFLVGTEAFERTAPFLIYRTELVDVARIGFSDLMAVPPEYPFLGEEMAMGEGVPVISLNALILMKLLAFRKQDQADVQALLRLNETQIPNISDYLADHSPDLLVRLGSILGGR